MLKLDTAMTRRSLQIIYHIYRTSNSIVTVIKSYSCIITELNIYICIYIRGFPLNLVTDNWTCIRWKLCHWQIASDTISTTLTYRYDSYRRYACLIEKADLWLQSLLMIVIFIIVKSNRNNERNIIFLNLSLINNLSKFL